MHISACCLFNMSISIRKIVSAIKQSDKKMNVNLTNPLPFYVSFLKLSKFIVSNNLSLCLWHHFKILTICLRVYNNIKSKFAQWKCIHILVSSGGRFCLQSVNFQVTINSSLLNASWETCSFCIGLKFKKVGIWFETNCFMIYAEAHSQPLLQDISTQSN